jgi:hypothetical protein
MAFTETKYLNHNKNEKLRALDDKLHSIIPDVLKEYPLPDEKYILGTSKRKTFYDFMSNKFSRLQLLINAKFGKEKLSQYNKLIVLKFLSTFDKRIEKIDLPQSIISLYPRTTEYISESLVSDELEPYNFKQPHFAFDLHLLLFQSVPGGSGTIDLSNYLPHRFLMGKGIKDNFRRLFFLIFQLGGFGPLFTLHTDIRNLNDFNFEGWNRCYLRVIDLLKQMPKIKGLQRTSWFIDPQIEKISPHLAYLRKVPCDNGAFLRIFGRGDYVAIDAIKTSKTRRKLYEEGKYTPTAYSYTWPRRKIIKWSKSYKR